MPWKACIDELIFVKAPLAWDRSKITAGDTSRKVVIDKAIILLY
jgi:hypothetical protein